METGTVKFFNDTKGFGFIKVDNSAQEIFVHKSGLVDSITKDDRVQFNKKDSKKGEVAVDVTRIED